MSGFTRRLKAVAAIAAVLLVGGSALLLNDGTAAQAAKNVTIAAGGGSAGIAVELFRPDNVVVNVGDTLTVTNDYEEPHTFSYVVKPADVPPGEAGLTQPFGSNAGFNGSTSFSSGLINKGDSYSVNFPTGGSFHFICLLHPGMAVDVTVVGAGIFTPPVDQAAAAATLQAGIAAGEAASSAVVIPAPKKNANGTTTWTVETGPSVPFHSASVDVMRFLPAKINIGVGDTINWFNPVGVPHTVTFNVDKANPAEINPFVSTKNQQVFNPAKYTNAIISAAPDFGGVQNFSLTFTQPGTYSYICLLHADQGMAGVITVGAGGATGGSGGAISPPNTGDAGLLGESSGTWMIYAGAAMLVASLIAAGGLAFISRRD